MSYFKDLAWDVFDNGYNIIPIAPGRKAPLIQKWSELEASEDLIKQWMKPNAESGIGINCRFTPAIDIDCFDISIIEHMEEYIANLLDADLSIRQGNAPKILIMCRTTEPFTKIQSDTYSDEDERSNKLEILGDGQQFVAYHTHPDTNKPYRWLSKSEPLTTHADDLPFLSEKHARLIVNEFERVVREWTDWPTTKRNNRENLSRVNRDDPFSSIVAPINIDYEVLRDHLMMIDPEDYDIWYQVGMALYHQFDGGYDGLDLYVEWSSTSDKFAPGKCDKKWPTFGIDNKRKEPITARTILHLAKEATDSLAARAFIDMSDDFSRCREYEDWSHLMEKARKIDLNNLQRAALVSLAKNSHDRITGSKIPLPEVRKAMAFKNEIRGIPRWCTDYVYVTSSDGFYNIESKIHLSVSSFNASFNRELLTKRDILDGKSKPLSNASDLALNVHRVDIVNHTMYSPKRDICFEYSGMKMVNSFPHNQFAEIPNRITPLDKANVAIIKNHMESLLPDDRERAIFMSWMSFIVQNPGELVGWAVLLQGVDGDGKSFFAAMLRAVMGPGNVSVLNASTFEKGFTGWAEGQCVLAVEEIRLQGSEKYAVLNKIKPFLTNDVIEVEHKHEGNKTIENTTNYLLFTNFRDALPLNDNDRRYFVLFSRWQNGDELRAHHEKDPLYFKRLFDTLRDSAGAIRKWLLDYDLCDEFLTASRAPLTEARKLMILEAQPEEIQDLIQLIITENDPLVSNELLSITRYNQVSTSMSGKNPKGMRAMLQHAGFFKIRGRVRIDRVDHYFYSKKPERFTVDGKPSGWICPIKIEKYMQSHGVELEDDIVQLWDK